MNSYKKLKLFTKRLLWVTWNYMTYIQIIYVSKKYLKTNNWRKKKIYWIAILNDIIVYELLVFHWNKVSKVGNCCRGRSEGSLFYTYYTEVQGRVLLISLNWSTLPSIRTLYCWVLSKKVSSTILKVFDMTRSGIEPRSPGPLANTLPTRLMSNDTISLFADFLCLEY